MRVSRATPTAAEMIGGHARPRSTRRTAAAANSTAKTKIVPTSHHEMPCRVTCSEARAATSAAPTRTVRAHGAGAGRGRRGYRAGFCAAGAGRRVSVSTTDVPRLGRQGTQHVGDVDPRVRVDAQPARVGEPLARLHAHADREHRARLTG